MKNRTLIILSLLILALPLFSQSKLNINYACSYYGEKNPTSVYTFTSDDEAQSALKMITDASGLSTNFKLVAANVPNAAAVIFNNQRYILYNQTFMYNIGQRINYWASISILAHEVGHHLNGHSLTQGGSRPNLELEADKFSGFILAKLGATLSDAQSAINALVPQSESLTHPGRSARLAAIANGWHEGSKKNESLKTIYERPTYLFYNDKAEETEQVYIKKIASNRFILTADKGYEFLPSEYKTIDIPGDTKIFWFPRYKVYGYVENFMSLPTNQLIQCEIGSISYTNFKDNYRLSGDYLIIYNPNKGFDILVNGIFINKFDYMETIERKVNPAIKNISPYEDDILYIYNIFNGQDFVNIEISNNALKKAAFEKKFLIQQGTLSKK
jgi:hypothetical protein